MNPLRILHLIPRLTGGGMERRMGLIASGMAARGYEVHVACLGKGTNANDIDLPGVHVHEIAAKSNYDPALVWRLRGLCRKLQPNVLHTWGPQMDILGVFLGVPARRRVVMETNSRSAYEPGNWKTRLRRRLARGATVVCNSQAGQQYWQTVKTQNNIVIRNGQNIAQISETHRTPSDTLPVDQNNRVICYVGRLNATATRQKNLAAILKALQSLSYEHAEMKLLLCGDGDQRGTWEQRVKDMGIADRVAFLGGLPREQVWGLLKMVDVLVSVSFFEGCPNVVQEAMLCECPLVVSDIPEHREILTDQEAVMVDPNSESAIAEAIAEVVSDTTNACNRAKRARNKAEQWSVEKMLGQYEKLYAELARHM